MTHVYLIINDRTLLVVGAYATRAIAETALALRARPEPNGLLPDPASILRLEVRER